VLPKKPKIVSIRSSSQSDRILAAEGSQKVVSFLRKHLHTRSYFLNEWPLDFSPFLLNEGEVRRER
jgi:hypothetical protein